jgi:hypothetical protein
MRKALMLFLLVVVQTSWGVPASGRTPPAPAPRPLTLIPTAFEELNELRVNTGQKAVLNDGTMNAVYVKKIPAAGSIYLNFHVDVASGAEPVVLHAGQIYLQSTAPAAIPYRTGSKKWKAASEPATTPPSPSYAPMDWFIDTGSAEVRGEALTVANKAIVQFTIEVPRAGFDDLTLFVQSQRMGTVKEIRAQISKDAGLN